MPSSPERNPCDFFSLASSFVIGCVSTPIQATRMRSLPLRKANSGSKSRATTSRANAAPGMDVRERQELPLSPVERTCPPSAANSPDSRRSISPLLFSGAALGTMTPPCTRLKASIFRGASVNCTLPLRLRGRAR